MGTSFIQNLTAFASAGLGALLAISIGVSHRQLCALISFAAGTLLAVTVFHIIPDAWNVLPASAIILSLGSGYLLFHLISRYVFHVCPACAASHFEEQTAAKFKGMVLLLAIALTVHSVMDGIAITMGGEFASHGSKPIFLTITFHKLPEGLALCALLLKAGYDRKNAFWRTLLFETSTLAGWVIGVFLLKGFAENRWLDLMLIHIGGGFIYLALHATLNEMESHSPRFIFLFFLCGFILMGLIR